MSDSRGEVRRGWGWGSDPENPLIRWCGGAERMWGAKLKLMRLELGGIVLTRFLRAFRTQARKAAFERASKRCADQEKGDNNEAYAECPPHWRESPWVSKPFK